MSIKARQFIAFLLVFCVAGEPAAANGFAWAPDLQIAQSGSAEIFQCEAFANRITHAIHFWGNRKPKTETVHIENSQKRGVVQKLDPIWKWVYAVPLVNLGADLLLLLMTWGRYPKKTPLQSPSIALTLFAAGLIQISPFVMQALDQKYGASHPISWVFTALWSIGTMSINKLFRESERSWFGETLAAFALFVPFLLQIPHAAYLGIASYIAIYALTPIHRQVASTPASANVPTRKPATVIIKIKTGLSPAKTVLQPKNAEPKGIAVTAVVAAGAPLINPEAASSLRIHDVAPIHLIRADSIDPSFVPEMIARFQGLPANTALDARDWMKTGEVAAHLKQQAKSPKSSDALLKQVWMITSTYTLLAAFVITQKVAATDDMHIGFGLGKDVPAAEIQAFIPNLLDQVLTLSRRERGFKPKRIIIHGIGQEVEALAKELKIPKDNNNGHLRITLEQAETWIAISKRRVLPFARPGEPPHPLNITMDEEENNALIPLMMGAPAWMHHAPWLIALSLVLPWAFHYRAAVIQKARQLLTAA